MISIDSKLGSAKLDKPTPPEIVTLILLLIFLYFLIHHRW